MSKQMAYELAFERTTEGMYGAYCADEDGDMVECSIEYDYDPGQDGRTSGDADDCYESVAAGVCSESIRVSRPIQGTSGPGGCDWEDITHELPARVIDMIAEEALEQGAS